MSRYFIEISYKGTQYAGFQIQQNAITIQAEVERVLQIFFRKKLVLTGSSRTDAGVHALQNFFHFDTEDNIQPGSIYNLNALLPPDIAVLKIRPMHPNAHCRFDALSRQYRYTVYSQKHPFLTDTAYFFPFSIDIDKMKEAAVIVKQYQDFGAFAKRNSQVKTFRCQILECKWELEGDKKMFVVKANRFLRGMVRGLTGTMLQVGRNRISIDAFREIIESGDSSRADFSVPGHGLCLEEVAFAEHYFA